MKCAVPMRASAIRREAGRSLAGSSPKWNGVLLVSFIRALDCNLGNFLRTLATPEPIKDWSMTTFKEKIIKIGAKVVSHGRYVAFQMAEVGIPTNLFADILRLIAELRPLPNAAFA